MKEAAVRAEQLADLIELRLDCLAANELNEAELEGLLATLNRPVILTLRPHEQGGSGTFDLKDRCNFFSRSFGADFFDIEIDLTKLLMRREDSNFDWTRAVCSHHDFSGIPDDLEQIYEEIAATPARIVKIAVQGNDATDCIPVFKLLERAKKEGREIIAIAMGGPGVATRVLGPSMGSFLTYGALDDQTATAPGQVTAASLKQLYRIDRIDPQTMITGLIGHPVSHSASPHIHNAAFAASGVNGVFIPFEVQDVGAFIGRMVKPTTQEIDWHLRGLSVTAPYKSAVIEHLNSLDSAATAIGAVNTIVVEERGLWGFNTDAPAFIRALHERIGDLKRLNCAVIGAGGAARAALWGLRSQGASSTVFARDLKKASLVAHEFGAQVKPLARSRFDEFDLVVNATPLGTLGELVEGTPVLAEQLSGAHMAYDLVYNPVETRFLREARDAGCQTLGGLSMLVIQAMEQFKLWTGVDASYEVMHAAALHALINA